jgi:hypothetical protein
MGDLCIRAADAEAAAGARELDGNNGGPFVDKYLNANHPDRVTHHGEPWCAAFVSWCWLQAAREAGRPLPIQFSRGVDPLWRQLEQLGQVKRAAELEAADFQPGDLLFWDWNGDGDPDHVNLVHHVTPEGLLYTIGGNEGAAGQAAVACKLRGKVGELRHFFGLGRMFPDGAMP